MPPKGGGVRHDDVIAQRDVVRHMAVSQHQVVRTDARSLAVASGAMNGHAFPKSVVVADLRAGAAALPFQVLGLEPDAGKRKDLILNTETGASVDDHVGMQMAAGSENNLGADHTVRPNQTARADFRFGMDDGGGVDSGHV